MRPTISEPVYSNDGEVCRLTCGMIRELESVFALGLVSRRIHAARPLCSNVKTAYRIVRDLSVVTRPL